MTSDDVFAQAALRGLRMQILLQLAEFSWQACFTTPRLTGRDAFRYGYGASAAAALADALIRHDAPTIALKADAPDDLFAGL